MTVHVIRDILITTKSPHGPHADLTTLQVSSSIDMRLGNHLVIYGSLILINMEVVTWAASIGTLDARQPLKKSYFAGLQTALSQGFYR